MFEFQIALKYLIPRAKSLSSALISILSSLVISLVVWLLVVFLSITSGIEKNWIQKLCSVYAPIRITPTAKYHQSYFYKVDEISSLSGFQLKSISKKLSAPQSDPYQLNEDPEIPDDWAKKELDDHGNFIDPVKRAFYVLKEVQDSYPDLAFQDFEVAGATLKVELKNGSTSRFLSQMCYLLSQQDQNPFFDSLVFNTTKSSHTSFRDRFGIYLPKSFFDQGVKEGSFGQISYSSFSATGIQEQKIPIYIYGFYDPGVMPLGNRCAIVPHELTSMVSSTQSLLLPDNTPTNGIFVWCKEINSLPKILKKIQELFHENNIDTYWEVSSYESYEFSKEIFKQLQSDRLLFSLLGVIILVIACSNIISLLTLLVHDKRKEIAILISMGASSTRIAFIFGSCGAFLGIISSLVGVGLAFLTMKYLDCILSFLGKIQGRPFVNPLLFNQKIPEELSLDAIAFVCILTPIIAIIASLVPAIKACRVSPSEVLRSS